MINNEVVILTGTAAIIGFTHTIFGPDHYLPFLVLAKARKWPLAKTIVTVLFCGCGHILSSVVLGVVGIACGAAIFKLKNIEALRGDWAAWLLLSFGFAYSLWGIYQAIRWPHKHLHRHDGSEHSHPHCHSSDHCHIHSPRKDNLTPWVLFLIFVFGPCEPLIPLLLYPAARHNLPAVVIVTLVFGLVTILTMLAIVLAAAYGLSKLPLHKFERFSHALAGLAIFACGAAIKFFGL